MTAPSYLLQLVQETVTMCVSNYTENKPIKNQKTFSFMKHFIVWYHHKLAQWNKL